MRSAATLLFALAALAPSLARAQRPPFRPETLPRLRLRFEGPMEPSAALGVHAAAGRNDPLLGPGFAGWRAVPELLFALHPAPRVEIYFGGGMGSARVVPLLPRIGRAELDLTLSAVLGVRFPLENVPVTATARAESIDGHGTAVMLSVRLNLDALGVPR